MSKHDVEQESQAGTEDPAILLRELISQQGVGPVEDLNELSDLWPTDDDPDLLLLHVLEERAARRGIQIESDEIK